MEKIEKSFSNANLDYSNVAIGSIFCLSSILNKNDINFAISRAEILLNIDKNIYYNQFVKTVNLFIKKYINVTDINVSNDVIENKNFLLIYNVKFENMEYNLLINNENLDEIIIAIIDNDKLIIERDKKKLKKIIYLIAREMTIVLE